LMRNEQRLAHRAPAFQSLLRATRSRMIEHATAVRLESNGVSFYCGHAWRRLRCDTLVFAAGAKLSAGWLRVLRAAKILDADLSDGLQRALSWEEVARAHPRLTLAEKQQIAVSSRPDLWDYLFAGCRGVRFAGGALHIGASNAGIKVSIATGRLAVRSILGHSPPEGFKRPLHRALFRLADVESALGMDDPTYLQLQLRPLKRLAGLRHSISPYLKKFVEDHDSSGDSRPDTLHTALAVVHERDRRIADVILSTSYGHASLRDIALSLGMSSPEDNRRLLNVFRLLCSHGALSWLPPRLPSTRQETAFAPRAGPSSCGARAQPVVQITTGRRSNIERATALAR
jgi:hypothetical protein